MGVTGVQTCALPISPVPEPRLREVDDRPAGAAQPVLPLRLLEVDREARVEEADARERAATDGHVVRGNRDGRADDVIVVAEVELALAERAARAERRRATLEPQPHAAAEALGVGVGARSADERREPRRGCDDVVVDEDEELAARVLDAAVAR